eukprot:gene6497-6725_t
MNLDGSTGGKVVCIGEALFDFLANDKGVPREQVKSWTPYPGGAPANVATCLTKLGVKTAFVSALGNDERGQELLKLLNDIGVDTSTVQHVEAPTRDIYVERTTEGDRKFAGFGLPSDQYCDCFLDEGKLPIDVLSNADILVTGTLGLAAPKTRAAIKAAAAAVKAGGGKVLVDINWRPVFWDDQEAAKKEILEYLEVADIVKISDADLEFLYDIPFLLEAGGLDRLLANPQALREAVVFAAATGALTCTGAGAIAAQPHLEQVEKLFEESKGWYNFWPSQVWMGPWKVSSPLSLSSGRAG